MELFLFERCNSFRGVNLNLYMNQLAFNPGPDPERWHRGLSRFAWLPSLVKFFILNSESEIKEKRCARDLGQFVVFVFLVVGTIISNSNLSAS